MDAGAVDVGVVSGIVGLLANGAFFTWLKRRKTATQLAGSEPKAIPKQLPHRTAAQVTQVVQQQVQLIATDEMTAEVLREIDRALAERDRYQHALEAISLLGHESVGPRIALQALKKVL